MSGLFLVATNLSVGLCLYYQTAKQPDPTFTSLKPQITCSAAIHFDGCGTPAHLGNVRYSDRCNTRPNKSQNI